MANPDWHVTRREGLAMMAGAIAAACAPSFCRAEDEMSPLRLAVSIEVLAGANVKDARAAYLVWLQHFATQHGMQIATLVPEVFLPSEVLIRYVRQSSIDGYGVTALELAKLADLTDPDCLLLQDDVMDGIEYVLLVHNSSHFGTIADLRNARVVSHLHRDMVLLPAWLSTMLAANNLPQPDRFFASQTLSDKVNQVVLPVFFRRVDAACLARRNWEMAVELNPQLGHDLRPLAISPKIIPIVMAFRRGTNSDELKGLIDTIQKFYSGAAGQQIIAMYQSRTSAVRPLSVMKTTLEMVRQFERVSGQQAASRKGQS